MKDSGRSRMRVFFDPEYYEVTETKVTSVFGSFPFFRSPLRTEVPLGLIGSNYKIQILNVDSQLGQTINIDIKDLSGPPIDIPTNQASFTTIAAASQASADTD